MFDSKLLAIFLDQFRAKSCFSSIFHALSRSKLPRVWPGPIPGPYQPFPATIHHSRPSIPPTSSSNFALQNFFEIFVWYCQSLLKTHRNLGIILPIGNFKPNFNSSKGPPITNVIKNMISKQETRKHQDVFFCVTVTTVIFTSNLPSSSPSRPSSSPAECTPSFSCLPMRTFRR